MNLLGSILSGVLGGQSGNSSLANVIGGLLAGQQGGGIAGALFGGQPGGGAVGGLFGGHQAPQPGPQAGMGGLMGLIERFQQAGMGNVAQSWVGTGPNEPVSPHDLERVLGQQEVQQMAQQANMPPQDLLSQLSQFLPHVVDRLTPNGQLPSADTFGPADAGDPPTGGAGGGKIYRT